MLKNGLDRLEYCTGGGGVWYPDPYNGHYHGFTTGGPSNNDTSSTTALPPYVTMNFIIKY